MKHQKGPDSGGRRPLTAPMGDVMKTSAQRWTMAAIACAVTGLVGMLLTATVARAVPPPPPRFIEGNVTTCDEAGLTGEIILMGEGDASSDAGTGDVHGAENELLDVTINSGWTASGIVVKGGPDANAYDGPFVGPTTIEDMHSPPNPGGNIPAISHWFVCGTTTPPSPSPSPTMSPTPSPTMSPTPSPTMSPTMSPTPSPTKPTVIPTHVPSGPVKAGGGGSQSTDGWLLGSAALLLAAPLAGALAWRRRRDNS